MLFKRVHMSSVSNSLPSEVNHFVLVETTDNANGANEALMVNWVCAALHKYTPPFWSMWNRLYKHLYSMWYALGIILLSEMVSVEKHFVLRDCYRLELGETSICKTLLQSKTNQFSMQFSVKGGLETTRLNVSLTVGLVSDVSITRLIVSYHIKTFVCACGILAQWEVN